MEDKKEFYVIKVYFKCPDNQVIYCMGPHAEVSEKLKDLHGLLNKKRFIPTQLFSDDKFYFDTDNIAYICIESMENNEHLSDIFEKLWALKDK